MSNENEKKMMQCGDTEACTCKPYNPYEDTVPLMLSPDYKDRFVAEYRQTKIRYKKLKAYCNRIEMAVPGEDYGLAAEGDEGILVWQGNDFVVFKRTN